MRVGKCSGFPTAFLRLSLTTQGSFRPASPLQHREHLLHTFQKVANLIMALSTVPSGGHHIGIRKPMEVPLVGPWAQEALGGDWCKRMFLQHEAEPVIY
jgi:hypothetical protein